jgi:hypothetical protein
MGQGYAPYPTLMAAVLQGHAQHAPPYAHNASTMGRLGLPSCLLEAVFM